MKSTDYIEAAKKALNINSDYAMAKAIGITRSTMSGYRNGNIMDDFTAAQIAEILKIDPLIVIAAANAEREKGERREYWEKVSKRLGGIAAGFLFFSIALPLHGITSAAQCILC